MLEKKRALDDKEIQLVRSIDRYAFFSVTSHDQLVLLRTAPLLKKLMHTPAGPPTSPQRYNRQHIAPVKVPPKEASRIAKWICMLVPQKREHDGNVETWLIQPLKEAKFREQLYKGIPDRW